MVVLSRSFLYLRVMRTCIKALMSLNVGQISILTTKLAAVVRSGPISNSSKLLCTSSLPVSMKKIRSKTAEKKWQHRFPHYKSIGIFSDAQGHLTPLSVVRSGRTSNSSELLRMSSLPASEKDPTKNSREKVATPFPHS